MALGQPQVGLGGVFVVWRGVFFVASRFMNLSVRDALHCRMSRTRLDQRRRGSLGAFCLCLCALPPSSSSSQESLAEWGFLAMAMTTVLASGMVYSYRQVRNQGTAAAPRPCLQRR